MIGGKDDELNEAVGVIASFGDEATEELYDEVSSKKTRKLLPLELHPIAVRKLDMIEAATSLSDLRVPPGNRLEALKGDLDGFWSIRINDQYRIVFRWDDDSAHEVRIVDYHR